MNGDRNGQIFAPVDLSPYFNAGRQPGPGQWDPATDAALAQAPEGLQRFWGIPFWLGPHMPAETIAGTAGAAGSEGSGGVPWWVLLGEAVGQPQAITIPIVRAERRVAPTYLVIVHICATLLPPTAAGDEAPDASQPWSGSLTRPGQRVADYVLVYSDGTEHSQPIRWRFEISDVAGSWPSRRAFAARTHIMGAPVDFHGPYPRDAWGRYQRSVRLGDGCYWVYALPNPYPDRSLGAVRLQATGADTVAVAALTQFFGHEHPLRHRRLESFRVSRAPLPAMMPRTAGDVAHDSETAIDLGIVARQYSAPAFDLDTWLSGEGITSPIAEPSSAASPGALMLDITASADATLRIGSHDVPLHDAYQRGEARSTDGAVRVELVDREKTWLHVTVEDEGTGQPIPSRVHFRAPDGRYLPPYGHRQEVNDNWFEDYGNDLKLHGTQYAYVDGAFQIELPVGDVYVELSKGFEYRPLRQKLTIQPGQRTLTLRLERPLDWRSEGWVTADTHVHFLSPQMAWLQGQAEGLNLVNLLAAQWGDLFTNVGDITGRLSGVSSEEMVVWVGTENRQHMLGHMSLLGVQGEPVLPLSAAGPSESYLGDPTWTTLADWADEARRRDGVVVIPHFPSPIGEVAADIILQKVDALELSMINWGIQLHEWYRYLNCGYRTAVVGGTDKMSAAMPVGAIRTYALLGDGAPFRFEEWASSVRAGRTFATTGPLLDMRVEGRRPGQEVHLPAGGGTLHVEVRAEAVVPFHEVEVVVNGNVVAAERTDQGMLACTVRESVRISGSAWIAARCTSRMDRWIGSPCVVAAHTSPVYVVAGREELFSPSDAGYMLTLLEGGLTWLETLSIPPSPERHARACRVFEDARDQLHRRMHAHGRAHAH